VKLTKRTVDATRPSSRDVFVWDEGFGLKVTPKGKKVFLFQYWSPTEAGKKRRVTLGNYGALTLDQARSKAVKLAGRVANGEDPAGEKIANRIAAKEATVSLLSSEYIAEISPKKKPRTIEEYKRQLRIHVIPPLGAKPVANVTHSDVAKLHTSMSDTPVSANRVIALLSAFLGWCERRGYRARNTNPCYGIEMYPEQSRERFLTTEEIAKLSEALKRAETVGLPTPPTLSRKPKSEATRKHTPISLAPIPHNIIAVNAIRFLLLTGWREQEALTLQWADVDTERGLATLPDTKSGKSHRPLGAPALALLDELPRVKGNPYVFPGAVQGKPLQEIRRTWYAARHAAGLDDVRLHDLRHTVASFAVGAGHSLFLTGKLLGHSNPSTTNKYAHLLDDARRATADAVSGAIYSAMQGGNKGFKGSKTKGVAKRSAKGRR
jgi:integrase